ncbi:MAG: glutamate-1-semialdehyde 2,1-aminomutase [Deltaproteobacteria bacterium]|nr:glutamate-1-semialdehyde 2,1-aminomutase [Deltaproteobacteria bacterium]
MGNNTISEELYSKAVELIPGGVNSPVRAFRSVGLHPRFIKSGSGCRVMDEDGNSFVDYVCSWGPLILGHAHPEVLEALALTMKDGTSFGAPTRREIEMAELIAELVPSIEMVRLVSSGTEATMSAIRLARGYTGRDKIVKFSGCYHGHSDGLLAKAGSGAATFSIPDSLGAPKSLVEQTIVLPYNDIESMGRCFEEFGSEIAAVIVEPVAGNMGVVCPVPGFLRGLRDICSKSGALLIFDEVISGFRVGLGGAQELYKVLPDLTCLGKIIGGGLPVGAFGGPRRIMELLAPVGGVYQAGTLSGNPLAVSAGLTTLKILKRDNPYQSLENKSARLADGLGKILSAKGLKFSINRVGSLLSVFFGVDKVNNYEDAGKADRSVFNSFFSNMLERGVYLAPSAFEAWFVSAAHLGADIEFTLECAEKSI